MAQAFMARDVAEFLKTQFQDLPSGLRHDKYPQLDYGDWNTCKEKTINDFCGPIPYSSTLFTYALALSPPLSCSFHARLESRLLVNHAGGIPENTGLSLHPIFGIPFIPGTALRGVARAAAIQELAEAESPQEKQRLLHEILLLFGFIEDDLTLPQDCNKASPDILQAWGDPSNPREPEIPQVLAEIKAFQGVLSFLHAMPVEPVRIVKDIVTCHHMKYYQGETAFAMDSENPNPQTFPAVESSGASGAHFRFLLILSRRWKRLSFLTEKLFKTPFDPLTRGKELLIRGLAEQGVGAKTSSGYGWFSYNPQEDERLCAEEQKRRERRHQEVQQKKAEKARQEELAALSPEDRFREELRSMSTEAINGCISKLESRKDEEKKVLLAFLREERRELWKSYLKDEETARKKKKENKGSKRAAILREAAQKLGVELP